LGHDELLGASLFLLFSDETFQFIEKFRECALYHVPNFIRIDMVVGMDENVSHAGYPAPGDIVISIPEFL